MFLLVKLMDSNTCSEFFKYFFEWLLQPVAIKALFSLFKWHTYSEVHKTVLLVPMLERVNVCEELMVLQIAGKNN